MNFILFDDSRRDHLLPLTFTRPTADIRIGILTIRQKWELYLNQNTSSLSEQYLSKKFPLIKEDHNILINGSVCPNDKLVKEVQSLKPGQVLVKEDYVIALYITSSELSDLENIRSNNDEHHQPETEETTEIICDIPHLKINNTWDIFVNNGQALEEDFELLTKGRKSEKLSSTNNVLCEENIFIEKGAEIEFATINAKNSKVYIGKNAKILEGALIRGNLALLDNSQLNMGAKIYGPTTIGPFSKVGGEVNNSVIFGYSNKGHEGFLGNSVIGEWCNIGADSNTSNLKNTYEEVRLWSYVNKSFSPTGQQFAGLIMADHSKCGINTMFNTGTVVGVNANIYGAGFQRNYIPSFSWGSPAGMKPYVFKKAVQVAKAVFERRNLEFDQTEQDILSAIYKII